jgi:hypothetical protein
VTAIRNDQAVTSQAIQPAATTRSRRRFALHVGEMFIAMIAGMLVLGGVVELALSIGGASLHDAPPAAAAAVMGVNMTIPMVWWMRRRGHGSRDNAEMAGSMLVPTAMAIALHWIGAISADSVMVIQHVVMIPAMVGVMLLRYDHYAH